MGELQGYSDDVGTANLPAPLELGEEVHPFLVRASILLYGKTPHRLLPSKVTRMEHSLSTLWTAEPITRVKFQYFLARDMLSLTRKEIDYIPKELQELVYPGRSQGNTAGIEFQGGRGITLKKEESCLLSWDLAPWQGP